MNEIEKAIKTIVNSAVLKVDDVLVIRHEFNDEKYEDAESEDIVLTLHTEDNDTFYVTKDEFEQVSLHNKVFTFVNTEGDSIDLQGFVYQSLMQSY